MNTTVLKVDPLKITFDGIHAKIPASKTLDNLKIAADIIRQNQPVAFPTETVYGLGANCQSTSAVQSIYSAKKRPADNPLIIHISSQQQLESTLGSTIPPIYNKLIAKFWPGPLTILLPLPAKNTISPLCTKGQTTFGVRLPQHPIARALIDISGLPLAAPSANASTKPSCTTANHVFEDLNGRVPIILDGGPAEVGVESTVVDGLVSPPLILRPGGVSLEQIREEGGPEWANVATVLPVEDNHEHVRAPGMKYRHYSPRAPVIVFEKTISSSKLIDYLSQYKSVAFLGTKCCDSSYIDGFNGTVVNLPLGTTGREISHNLFTKFREADAAGVDCILIEAVDTSDEGLAIMNRMHKAAAAYLH